MTVLEAIEPTVVDDVEFDAADKVLQHLSDDMSPTMCPLTCVCSSGTNFCTHTSTAF